MKSEVCFTVSHVGGWSPTHSGGLDAPVPDRLLNRLQSVLNATARSITGLRRSDLITDGLRDGSMGVSGIGAIALSPSQKSIPHSLPPNEIFGEYNWTFGTKI